MRHRWRALRAVLVASLFVLAVTGAASAGILSITEDSFRITWNNFQAITDSEYIIECRVTLEGTFNARTIPKSQGILVGRVNSATVGTCASGILVLLPETLPWHFMYDSFTGTLPNILLARVLLIGAGISGEIGLWRRCLGTTTTTRPLRFAFAREARGSIIEVIPDPGFQVPVSGPFCIGSTDEARLAGAGNPFIGGSTTTRINMSLIA